MNHRGLSPLFLFTLHGDIVIPYSNRMKESHEYYDPTWRPSYSIECHMELKIISVEITEQPKSFFDPMPKVIATFEDGGVEELFEYYPDEITFSASEFKGLTRTEAITLKFDKDKAFILEGL